MKLVTLSHQTTFATISIARLPDVTEEAFERTMIEDVLPATSYPLNRSDNVIAQEFRKNSGDEAGTYQWVIVWNGVSNMNRISSGCETIYGAVKATVERVGTRTGLSVATLRARWED